MNFEFLAEVNRVRSEHGLASLGWSDKCFIRAEENAKTVARWPGSLWHPKNGVTEIAARGQVDIADACDSWLKSKKGHREILLGQYLSIGVAMAVGVDGQLVWFAQFE